MKRIANISYAPLRAFWRRTEGGSAVMVALGSTAVFGAAALAIFSELLSLPGLLDVALSLALLSAVGTLTFSQILRTDEAE